MFLKTYVKERNLMRKFVTLLAATTLLASTVALAEDQNSNDVLQTVPHQQNAEGMNVAENDMAAKPAADQAMAQEPAAEAAKPAKKHHHKKHHHAVKHHNHHHKAKAESTEAAPAAA
jgi:protein-disulfide isomerase-like protein with CxxC motif